MLFCKTAALFYVRADSVDDILCRQVVASRNLCISSFLFALLDMDDFRAVITKHGAGCSMDDIINTVMKRLHRSEQSFVCGIDHCISAQSGNVSLPEAHFIGLRN